jgi:hypothetical protein
MEVSGASCLAYVMSVRGQARRSGLIPSGRLGASEASHIAYDIRAVLRLVEGW